MFYEPYICNLTLSSQQLYWADAVVIPTLQKRITGLKNWLGDVRARVQIKASSPEIPAPDHFALLFTLYVWSKEECSGIIT